MWDINNWGRRNFADEGKTFAWWCWSHLLLSAGQEDFQSSSPNAVYFLRSPTCFQMLFALCFLLNTITSNSQPLSWDYVAKSVFIFCSEEEFLCLNSTAPGCHISSGPPATIAAISNHVSRQFNASLSTPALRRVPNFSTQTETYFEQQQRFANGSGLNPTPTHSGWLVLLSAPNPFAESFFKNQHFGVTIVGYWVWKINKLTPF